MLKCTFTLPPLLSKSWFHNMILLKQLEATIHSDAGGGETLVYIS